MAGIKAIETVYGGYRFRSRLEARWAVFFDTLGVPYEYEKEGFDLDGLWYLPDFWLPKQQAWFEVKGADISDEDLAKAGRLYSHHRKINPKVEVFIFQDIPRVVSGEFITEHYGNRIYVKSDGDIDVDNMAAWQYCPVCSSITIESWVNTHMLRCKCLDDKMLPIWQISHHFNRLEQGNDWWFELLQYIDRLSEAAPPLMKAFQSASQARFEHGRHGN